MSKRYACLVIGMVCAIAGASCTSRGSWKSLRSPLSARMNAAAITAGNRAFVWGGLGGDAERPLADGALFDGAHFTMLPRAPIGGRSAAAIVWTGSEVLVWGGNDPARAWFADGAAYDPARKTWRSLGRAPLAGRARAAYVWTGREMIVWGGLAGADTTLHYFDDGAAYDPSIDSWRTIAPAPSGARNGEAAVWSGHEMILWGGVLSPGAQGVAYDPATDRWRTIADAPIAARDSAGAVWTGTELLVSGGEHGTTTFSDGAAFDPARNTWRAIASAPQPARYNADAIWTGTKMIVANGFVGSQPQALVASYDPAKDAWGTLPQAFAGGRAGAATVWAGGEVIVIGGRDVEGTLRADAVTLRAV